MNELFFLKSMVRLSNKTYGEITNELVIFAVVAIVFLVLGYKLSKLFGWK